MLNLPGVVTKALLFISVYPLLGVPEKIVSCHVISLPVRPDAGDAGTSVKQRQGAKAYFEQN